LIHSGKFSTIYKVDLTDPKHEKPTIAACIKVYRKVDLLKTEELMEREREVTSKLLKQYGNLRETGECYVSLTEEVPLTESHMYCNVFAYLPYSWADAIKHDECRLPYEFMKRQFKLVLMSIASIHKAGIAHSCIQPSAIRLSHGLIPHIVGFEHAWKPQRKVRKEDRIHSEIPY